MKKPIDRSQNCACGACRAERNKYHEEMKKFKAWIKNGDKTKGTPVNLTTNKVKNYEA